MVKLSEISRQITYEFTDAVAKLLERLPCMLDPLPSHTKEFKHDNTAAAHPLGDQHWANGNGRPVITWLGGMLRMCLARDISEAAL